MLLLLFLVALGNKACKTIHVPVRFRAEQATSVPPVKAQTRAKVLQSTVANRPPDAEVGQSEDVADNQPKKTNKSTARVKTQASRRDSISSFPGFPLPHIQTISAEEELDDLSRRINQGYVINSDRNSDSGRAWQKTAVESGKLLANTGSSYFNAEVQPNMNDQLRSVFTTRLLYDSVISKSNKDFVYNTLTINNTGSAKLDIQVIVSSPAGWQMVTSNITNITLEPFGNTISQ